MNYLVLILNSPISHPFITAGSISMERYLACPFAEKPVQHPENRRKQQKIERLNKGKDNVIDIAVTKARIVVLLIFVRCSYFCCRSSSSSGIKFPFSVWIWVCRALSLVFKKRGGEYGDNKSSRSSTSTKKKDVCDVDFKNRLRTNII